MRRVRCDWHYSSATHWALGTDGGFAEKAKLNFQFKRSSENEKNEKKKWLQNGATLDEFSEKIPMAHLDLDECVRVCGVRVNVFRVQKFHIFLPSLATRTFLTSIESVNSAYTTHTSLMRANLSTNSSECSVPCSALCLTHFILVWAGRVAGLSHWCRTNL